MRGMDSVWLRERFEKNPDKTQRALAIELGLDPAAVNRMLKGERQVKLHEVPVIRKFFGEPEGGATGDANLYNALSPNRPWATSGDRIPVMGVAQGGADGLVDWNGEIVDWVGRPPALAGAPNAYAVYVSGSSMEPRYQEGELVYVHPGRPVSAGNYCVVQFAKDENALRRAFVKQFVKRTAKAVILRQFRPEKDIDIPIEQVISVHRIVASGEP
jgi:phage repressor protein C with HTH and peptisase S24 domain